MHISEATAKDAEGLYSAASLRQNASVHGNCEEELRGSRVSLQQCRYHVARDKPFESTLTKIAAG